MVNLKAKPYYLSDADIAWVEETIAAMTPEEKVGQLFWQLTAGNSEEYLKELMEKYVASNPDPKEACAVSVYMIEEPMNYKGRDAYWFMYVVLAFIRDLIPIMSKEDCAMLAEKLNSLYKKRDRMPVQEDTYKKLVKASK